MSDKQTGPAVLGWLCLIIAFLLGIVVGMVLR